VIKLGIGFATLLASILIAARHQRDWEYPVIWSINTYANRSAWLDYFIRVLTECDLFQGVALISLFWYLWFSNENGESRAQLLVGTVAASLAGTFSRVLQLLLPTHLRPLHSQEVGFVLPMGVEVGRLNHYNSFPSDHGALFFALALVIFSTHHRLGLLAFAWAVVLNVARIYEGFHFPSDVVGSIGLALIVVTLLNHRWFNRIAYGIVTWGQTRQALFYMLAFLVTYQISNLFIDAREFGRGFADLVVRHNGFGGGG
jgi:undecaprenyl-diphosphatase